MLNLLVLCFLILTLFTTSAVPFTDQQQSDKIINLPGQKFTAKFNHYSGYVTVEETSAASRNLFYCLIESPDQPTTKPLVLWLNGRIHICCCYCGC